MPQLEVSLRFSKHRYTYHVTIISAIYCSQNRQQFCSFDKWFVTNHNIILSAKLLFAFAPVLKIAICFTLKANSLLVKFFGAQIIIVSY